MGDVTTFCSLWLLSLSNGEIICITDHDAIISYDGNKFHPRQSGISGLTETHTNFRVDSGGLKTHLTLPNISTQDICDGILDGATLSQFRHDWRSGQTRLLSKGRVGEVTVSGDEIDIEWLGLSSVLNRSTGRVFSRQCDASFCDPRCGLQKTDFPDGTTCPRTFEACRDQFSNAVNFRGFPYLLGDDVLQAGVRESDRRDGSSRYQ